jgi:hypothetical protein
MKPGNGTMLVGPLKGLWKVRVGKYRASNLSKTVWFWCWGFSFSFCILDFACSKLTCLSILIHIRTLYVKLVAAKID